MRAQEVERSLLRAAAEVSVAVPMHYARQGIGLAQVALAGAQSCERLRHYPSDDVHDLVSGTRFYYHAHESRRRPDEEHGHFHLFIDLPPDEPGNGPSFCHLAALSLDAQGRPLRWFTTNRWVTAERWVGAPRVLQALPGFAVHTTGRLAPLARWLNGMVQIYTPQLTRLLLRRDEVLARRIARQGAEQAFEDRRLDVVTEARISLPQRIAQLGF